MQGRQTGRRCAAAAAKRRTAVRPAGRRQAGKGMSDKERIQLIRLVICGGVFVLLVAAKLLLPGKMAAFNQKLSETMTRSVDVQAVFSAVGGLFDKDGTPAETADQVYQAVFHPETAAGKTAARSGTASRSLQELQSWRDAEAVPDSSADSPPAGEETGTEETAMDLVLYSDEDLPDNVSMRQSILGFDHETPVKGVLSSNFGYREHPVEGEERFHYGVDLAADTGTAIACFADGTVTAVGESSSYGKYCTVTHANGCTTLYAHCSRISVSSGAAVKEGEKLGEVGETGMATGPHLHFELQKDGVYLNPIYYVETARVYRLRRMWCAGGVGWRQLRVGHGAASAGRCGVPRTGPHSGPAFMRRADPAAADQCVGGGSGDRGKDGLRPGTGGGSGRASL